MSSKVWEAMKNALHNLSPNTKSIILTSDGSLSENGMTVYGLTVNFDMNDVLAIMGDTSLVGIIDSEKFDKTRISELINILTNKNKATVVRVNANPVSCRIFHPIPDIKEKYINGNYEYRYGQAYGEYDKWEICEAQNGWGVRVVDDTQTDYVSPLTMIKGHPVTNMSWLFYRSQATTLNLINWDTSNVTNMNNMFDSSQATHLDLGNFDTSNVVSMSKMFYYSKATSLALSRFNTSNVIDMFGMFSGIRVANIDLSSFDTSRVTTMSEMFYDSLTIKLNLSNFNTCNVTAMNMMFASNEETSLDLSSFDTSNVTSMKGMFWGSLATILDVSSFNTSKVTDMSYMFGFSNLTDLDISSFDSSNVTNTTYMFNESQIKNLTAKTQDDANKYQSSGKFPCEITITVTG